MADAAGTRSRRPRARWVTSIAPDFAGGGGHVRQAHLISSLARAFDVEVFVADHADIDPAIREVAEVHTLPGRAEFVGSTGYRRARDLVEALTARDPREIRRHSSVHVAAWPRLRALPPADLVLVEPAAMAPLVAARQPGERWVLTLHNLGSRMGLQMAEIAATRRVAWLERREALKARRFEREVASVFDAVVAVSAQDAALVGPGERVLVVPNGVDPERFRPSPAPEFPRVAFTGALYTRPNIDAVTWLCRDIFPAVRAAVPSAELVIAGRDPVAEIAELDGALDGSVRVRANVGQTAPVLADAQLAVAPLRVGSGSRLKILEALASRRPVVGTSIAYEGLDLPDRAMVVADRADTFAAEVVRLLHDPAAAEHIARAGQMHVVETYGWDVIGERFTDAMLGLLR